MSDIIEKIKCLECGVEIYTLPFLNNSVILTEKIKCIECGYLNSLEIVPEITSNPIDDSEDVPKNANIVLNFSVSMNEESVINNTTITPSIENVMTFDNTSKILTIDPVGNFSALTEYSMTLSKEAKSNNNIALKNDYIISFTTLESALANDLESGIPELGTPELTAV